MEPNDVSGSGGREEDVFGFPSRRQVSLYTKYSEYFEAPSTEHLFLYQQRVHRL